MAAAAALSLLLLRPLWPCCCGPYRLCLCMQQSTATKTAKKPEPERRREKRMRAAVIDSRSVFNLVRAAACSSPDRQDWKYSARLDEIMLVKLCNSATAWLAKLQDVNSRPACASLALSPPPLRLSPSRSWSMFSILFLSNVSSGAVSDAAGGIHGCRAERGMCHPSEGQPSLERGIHPV